MEVTLLTEDTRVHYTGDGVTKEFNYSFNPIDLSYVKVYKNLQQITTPDVTVASGVVTFNVAPAEGDSVVIMREKPLTYDSGIASKGIISSDSLDNMAVDLLGQIQQVNEKLDRVPVYPIDTTMTGEEILNQFNQDVQTVKDSRVEVEGKAEEINNAVSSGLTEISNATSESKSQITEEKNAAISAVETSTAPLIERAETAASEAEVSRANAEEWAKSVDAENIVHRTGDEEVGGNKTFTGISTFLGESKIKMRATGIDISVKPTTNFYNYIDFIDKNNKRIGIFGAYQDPLGNYGVYLQAGNQGNLNILTDGTNVYTNAPTPPTTDNGTQIATTNWVRQVAALKNLSNTTLTANRALYTNGSGVVAASAVTSTELGYLDGVTSSIQTQLNAKANLASPAFSGTPTAPTPLSSDNSTRIATTAWVKSNAASFGLPNYNAGVSGSQNFTASYNCLFFGVFYRTRDNTITMTLNNKTITLWKGTATYNLYDGIIQLYLSKGDKISFNYPLMSVTIYPLKGN